MDGVRTRRKVSQPEWSVVRRHLHLRIREAAVVLNATTKYLRQLCRQNNVPYWPGKKIRSTRRNLTMEADAPESSARAGLGGFVAEVVERNDMVVEDDIIRVDPPVLIRNHPPEELTTLNLIDRVGLPSNNSE